MFTGIVEETGAVESIRETAKGIQLSVSARVCGRGAKIGDSISVNGCCLTVAALSRVRGRTLLRFDLLRETWTRTNLQFARKSSAMNLERALAIGDRLGGHFVTGHIDGLGKIVCWECSGKDHV